MAQAPKPLQLRPEDFKEDVPEWATQLFEMLNRFNGQVVDCLSGRLTRTENLQGGEVDDVKFTTSATPDSDVVKFKWTSPDAPRRVFVNLKLDSGETLSGPWSYTTTLLSSNMVGISFQGLDASTAYRFSAVYE